MSMVAEIAIVDLRDVTTQGASLGSKTLRKEQKQLPRLCLRLRREILPAGLPGPVTEVAQFHPASLWLEDLGPTAAQCLPGPMDLNAIDHAVVNGVAENEVTGLRCHESSRFHHSTRHRESGERAWPTSSSGGSSCRSKQADVMDVRPFTSTHHQHHHSPCPFHRSVVPCLKLRRQRLPAGLPGPVTRRRPFHPASLWWEDPGPTAAQCLPGPTDLNVIDYAVVFGADEVHGSERLHNSPRSCHSPRRWRSGERTRPTSSGGSSSRARHGDPTDVQGSGCALGRATEVQLSSSATHHQGHHSRS